MKLIIAITIIVSSYVYVSSKTINEEINILKNHNAQLEEVMNNIN